MSALLSRIAEACQSQFLREKILVVPSLAIGHQIADAVAQSGTPWVNLRVETMRTLADSVAGFALAHEGVTVLSRAQALALIERACDRVLDSSSYFAALADRPGLHRAVQKSIDDLRHAGVDPAKLVASKFEDPRKARDLVRILGAYDEEMTRRKYIDRFGVLKRAIGMVEGRGDVAGDSSPSSRLGMTGGAGRGMTQVGDGDSAPGRPQAAPTTHWKDAIWIVVHDLELTQMEEKFLAAAAGEVERIGHADAVGSEVTFKRAVGEENELRGAFRSILDARTPFDDAEIVYTTRDPYLPLAYELASEYEVPCTFAEGIAAHFTRPGQAALAFLRWIGEGWHAAEIQNLTPRTRIARVMRSAAIGWGRERYLPRIDAYIAERNVALAVEESESRRAVIERQIADANDARGFVFELLRTTEAVADQMDVASASRAAAAFIGSFDFIRNEVDGMAREGLKRLFSELSMIGSAVPSPARGRGWREAPGEGPLIRPSATFSPAAAVEKAPLGRSEISARLADAVRNLHVSASNPRPGFLHVAPVRAGGWNARKRMFVVGLDEERHPGSGLQDPILLDVEREAIGIPLAGERPKRTTEQFRHLLSRAGNREVTLSWSSLRLRDRRERFPSTALLDVYRASTNRANATYEELIANVAKERFVDPMPLSESDWWLHRRFTDGDTKLAGAVLASYPSLAAGAEAEAARKSNAITKWDGRITALHDVLDPRLNGRVYSASQLETMASCPYRYFLDRILHIQPLDDLQYEPDTWLEANEFGNLLHEVLQLTMEELRNAKKKPALAFLPRMEEIAADALNRWRDAIPPPSDTAFDRRKRELIRSCEIFLRNEESESAPVTPTHFEYAFDTFDLPLGNERSVRLRGRIDRIDREDKSGHWHVWDYKSGGTWDFDEGGTLQCGTRIQHAVYARAVAASLGGKVTRSGYFFPTPEGRGARIERQCTDAELERALNLLFDTIGRGYFPHTQCASWCDFASICGNAKEAAERTAIKVAANDKDPAVRAWRALEDIK